MWKLKTKDVSYTPSGCAISGIMNTSGKRFSGEIVVKSIATMRFRSNGLGGGFAGYGIYPDNSDQYALHVIYQTDEAKQNGSKHIGSYFHIWREEPIPTVHVKEIENRPILWRYFVTARAETRDRFYDMTEDDIVIKIVFDINRDLAPQRSQEARIIAGYLKENRYDLMIDDHEDPSASGFYMYQYAMPSQDLSRKVIAAVRAGGLPIEQNVNMVILKTDDGLIDAPMWGLWYMRATNQIGVPNYSRLYNSDNVYTVETATRLDYEARLTAHQTARQLILDDMISK